MKITETKLKDFIEYTLVSEYGNYYFFKNFIISEIKQDVIFNWELAQEIIQAATRYYGDELPIFYISNRINQYSTNPIDWFKFFKAGKNLKGYAIVTETDNGGLNAAIENLFFSSKLLRFSNLFEAVNWVHKQS